MQLLALVRRRQRLSLDPAGTTRPDPLSDFTLAKAGRRLLVCLPRVSARAARKPMRGAPRRGARARLASLRRLLDPVCASVEVLKMLSLDQGPRADLERRREPSPGCQPRCFVSVLESEGGCCCTCPVLIASALFSSAVSTRVFTALRILVQRGLPPRPRPAAAPVRPCPRPRSDRTHVTGSSQDHGRQAETPVPHHSRRSTPSRGRVCTPRTRHD